MGDLIQGAFTRREYPSCEVCGGQCDRPGDLRCGAHWHYKRCGEPTKRGTPCKRWVHIHSGGCASHMKVPF